MRDSDHPSSGAPRVPRVECAYRASWIGRLFCVLLPLLAGEVFFRGLGYESEAVCRTRPYITEYFWVADSEVGFRNRASGCYTNLQVRGRPVVTTDSDGFRNNRSGQGTVEPAVVFVGDSTVFCGEVNDDQTVAAEVERLLNPEGDAPVRVLNAGVRAYNSLQASRQLDRCLDRFPGLKVAVYVVCDNDYFENVIPDVYEPLRAPVLRWDPIAARPGAVEVDRQVVPWDTPFWPEIQRLEPTRNAWREYRDRFLAATHSVLLQVAFRTAGAVWHRLTDRRPDAVSGSRSFMQYMPHWLEWTDRARSAGGDEILVSILGRMKAGCERRGCRFLVTRFTNGDDDAFEDGYVGGLCERAGVRFVSVKAVFTRPMVTYVARGSRFGNDYHYGPEGCRTMAEALVPAIREALFQAGTSRP